jgi:hypothetical protein
MVPLANLDKDTVPEARKHEAGLTVAQEEDLCEFITLLIDVALFAD